MSARQILDLLPSLSLPQLPLALFHLPDHDSPQSKICIAQANGVFYLFQTCRRGMISFGIHCGRAQTCSFGPIHASGVLNVMTHRCGKQPRPREVQLVRHLLVQMKAQGGDLCPRGIANTLSAIARLGIFDKKQDEELLAVLCEAAKRKVAEFNSQDIANTLIALAKFGVYDDKLKTQLGSLECMTTGQLSCYVRQPKGKWQSLTHRELRTL